MVYVDRVHGLQGLHSLAIGSVFMDFRVCTVWQLVVYLWISGSAQSGNW